MLKHRNLDIGETPFFNPLNYFSVQRSSYLRAFDFLIIEQKYV